MTGRLPTENQPGKNQPVERQPVDPIAAIDRPVGSDPKGVR